MLNAPTIVLCAIARIDLRLTLVTVPAVGAIAKICLLQVKADSIVGTWIAAAFVDVVCAPRSIIAGSTRADIVAGTNGRVSC